MSRNVCYIKECQTMAHETATFKIKSINANAKEPLQSDRTALLGTQISCLSWPLENTGRHSPCLTFKHNPFKEGDIQVDNNASWPTNIAREKLKGSKGLSLRQIFLPVSQTVIILGIYFYRSLRPMFHNILQIFLATENGIHFR